MKTSRLSLSAWLIIILTLCAEAYWLLSAVFAMSVSILLYSEQSTLSFKEFWAGSILSPRKSTLPVFYLSLAICLTVPLVGAIGIVLSLVLGQRYAELRHREPEYWQFTHNIQLPFTTPIGRSAQEFDSRSLSEQLAFSSDNTALYNKVLAAGKIRNSLSVDTLKQAIRHPDERIRLTAYQTIDRKSSELNLAIQKLEHDAHSYDGEEKSNIWLQIASNYWELLTLEQDEPVARRQLLDKASKAAQKAIRIAPENRNAHFILGRVALAQKKTETAASAFHQSMSLGMPSEKVVPYLAEVAFDERNFSKVATLLNSLDPAFKSYPPLSRVAQYWT